MRVRLFCVLLLTAGSLSAAQVGRPDLVVTGAGLNADGRIEFTISNRGDAAVNTPFKVEAWLDGYLRQTIEFAEMKLGSADIRSFMPRHLPLAPGEQRHFVLSDVKVDLCSNSHAVKVIADSGGSVAESSEANNVASWSGPTPCPDLAIKSISKHWQNNMHTEFTAEVVVINLGSGNVGPFSVAVGAFSNTSIPSGAPLMYDGLKAGGTLTIRTGNAYIPDSIHVHVVVDVGNVIKESNENNNVADATLH